MSFVTKRTPLKEKIVMDIQVPRPANPPPEFSSDPQRSKIRASALQDYFARNVLNGDQFVCPYAADCRASHPPERCMA